MSDFRYHQGSTILKDKILGWAEACQVILFEMVNYEI